MDGHPCLAASLVVDMPRLRLSYLNYASRQNPPVLHRKELLVGDDYPLRMRFARLTAQEERLGLYDEPSLIGSLSGWEDVLAKKGVRVSGHRVVRTKVQGGPAGSPPGDVAHR